MVAFGTYDVRVKIDNEPLPEFGVEVDEEGKRATCWIPSEAGKVGSLSTLTVFLNLLDSVKL